MTDEEKVAHAYGVWLEALWAEEAKTPSVTEPCVYVTPGPKRATVEGVLAVWLKAHPDIRLGQLITWLDYTHTRLFHVTDTELLRDLRALSFDNVTGSK